MTGTNRQLRKTIRSALRRVESLFLRQCEYGAQTRTLDQRHAACGQFIGQGAENNQQRGLHGIAAALRVLSSCRSDASQRIVRRLVRYCTACFAAPATVAAEGGLLDDRTLDNVIKLGELLHALSFVTGAEAEQLAHLVIGRLQESKIQDRGWGHFLDSEEPELLSSAYAIRGLAAQNENVTGPTEWIVKSLKERRTTKFESHADVTTAVACAYCLTFAKAFSGDDTVLATTFAKAWTVMERTFTEDLEQNLEYSHIGENHYVRVPMQLYLLALACDYGQREFASLQAQRRLTSILTDLENSSFKYPYSGALLSSRTNAIAYDVLDIVETKLRSLWLVPVAAWVDWLRVHIGSRLFRGSAVAVATLLVLWSVVQWANGHPSVGDFAPGLVNAALVAILAWGRR